MEKIILFGIEQAVKNYPAIAKSLKTLFSKGKSPTAAEWKAEHDKIEAETYDKLVPNSELPPE